MPTDALPQQRAFYHSTGKDVGRSTTESSGSTIIYGTDGRVSGRTSTDSQGTTTASGSDGRKAGRVSAHHKGRCDEPPHLTFGFSQIPRCHSLAQAGA
jgi:hypothetical protein